jgi:hypothetical protein
VTIRPRARHRSLSTDGLDPEGFGLLAFGKDL